MKLLKLMSLFLVSLVLSMPISLAATFTVYSEGQDGMKNFIRPTDELTLVGKVDGADVSEEDITYVPTSGNLESFDSCTNNVCTYTFDEADYDGVQRHTVRYASRSGNDDKVVNTLVDSVGPTIDSISQSKIVAGPNEMIKFNIKVSDTACNNILCNNRCSGISKIVISKDNLDNEIAEIPVNTDFDECADSIEKSFIVSELNLDEGLNALFFTAYDNFDNQGDFKTISLTVDSTPPSLQDETFYLTKDNEGIGYYNYKVPNVEVTFYLDDPAVASVKANFGELNPSIGLVDVTCDDILCKKTIELNPTLTKTKGTQKLEVPVTVVDNFGNSETYNLKSELEIDREPPIVKDVESSASYKNGDTIGISSNSNLKIIFNEDGVGMSNADAYIDYSAIGGSSSVKALNCTKDGVCVFPKVNLTKDGLNTLNVLTTTKDDLGNAMITNTPFSVYSDNTNPTINNIYTYFKKTKEDFPTRGDKLTVLALINDSSDVIGVGNFTLISNDKIIKTECKKGGSSSSRTGSFSRTSSSQGSGSSSGGSFERGSPVNGTNETVFPTNDFTENIDTEGFLVCEWEVPIDVSGTVVNGEMKLSFFDQFNNTISEVVDVPLIYGLFDEKNPNYWETSGITCSPSVLDREIGELMEQEMYCSFKLNPLTDGEQKITSMELTDCESDYLSDSSLSNIGTNPYITLVFDKDEYSVNDLQVTCNVEIMSVVGTNIVTNSELENVTIPVSFFNNPFGMPDDNLIDEIEDIKDTWADGFGDVIYWLSALEKISTEVCKTINTVEQIASVLSGVSAGIPKIYGGDVARSGTEVLDQGASGMFQSLNYFCKFVNCDAGTEMFGQAKGTGLGKLYDGMGSLGGGFIIDKMGGNFKDYMDVKNNIYWSAITLCIPGIIHGLAKYRQIQCFYGYCLQDMSVMGIPYENCAEQKAYQECKYFVTPIFTFFPIVNFFDDIMEGIKGAISDPFVAIGLIANLACTDFSQVGWSTCRVVYIINVATKAYNNVLSIMNLIDDFDHDYCDDLTDSPRSSSSGRGSSSSSGGSFSR